VKVTSISSNILLRPVLQPLAVVVMIVISRAAIPAVVAVSKAVMAVVVVVVKAVANRAAKVVRRKVAENSVVNLVAKPVLPVVPVRNVLHAVIVL
jgi:hypothetical protein